MAVIVPKIVGYDPHTGEQLSAPEEHLPDLVASGRAAFQKGQSVPVVSPSGIKSQIPAEDAAQAFKAGYQLQPIEDRFHSALQAQYGDIPHEVLAGIAGAARGLSLGTSDLALTKTGLVNPDTLESLKEANPAVSVTGDVVGTALPAVLSMGESAVASAALEGREGGSLAQAIASAAESPAGKALKYSPSGLVSKAGGAVSDSAADLLGLDPSQSLAARIAKTAVIRGSGSALEGAMFAGGNDLSEAALGDPNEVAHHAIADIGMGALIGGAFGVGMEGVSSGLKKLFPRVVTNEAAESAAQSQIAEDAQGVVKTQGEPSAPQAAQEGAEPTQSMGAEPSPGGQTETMQPQSIGEIQQAVAGAKLEGATTERPSAEVLKNSEALLAGDVKYGLLKPQIEAVENPSAYTNYQTLKVSDTPEGDAINEWEALQKAERVKLLNKTVSDVAPSGAPTANPSTAGEKAVGAFSDQYQAEQKELGKLFSKFDDVAPNTSIKSLDVIDVVKGSIPDAEKVLKVVDGEIQLQHYNAAEVGFGKETYNAISHIFKPLTEGEITVQGLRNLRGNLDDYVTAAPGSKKYATQLRNVGTLKSNLMALIGKRIHEVAPELNAPDFFKRYAINETNRAVMEKLFGGSVSEGAAMLKKIPLEKVGDNIFRNSVTVQAARATMGDAAFNELSADYLSEQIEKCTDKGVFSSQKFSRFLKANAAELGEAFKHNPEALQKINALTDTMRIIPDAPPINPSNTAPTASRLAKIARIGQQNHDITTMGAISKAIGKLAEMLDHGAHKAAVDAELSGAASVSDSISAKEQQYGVLKRIEDAAKRSAKTVSSGVESFVSNNRAASVAIPAAALYLTGKSERKNPYHALIDNSADIQSAPERIVEDMGNATARLSQHAPNVAQNISSLGTQAAMFLASKAPKDPNVGNTLTPGVHQWTPSHADTLKFKRYTDAVYHPLSVMNHINDNTLSNEEVETLQAVYPQIYKQICTEMVGKLTEMKAPLPYGKRLTVSRLLQVPYDASMQPQMIQALQAAHGTSQAMDAQGGLHNGSSGLNQKGLSKIDRAGTVMTDTQRVQTRGAS